MKNFFTNAEPETHHEIGNEKVQAKGFSAKITVTDDGRLQSLMCSNMVFTLS